MLASKFAPVAASAVRSFGSTTAASSKVAILGAGGGIGQPLSLLCKLSNNVSELACYDIVGTPGIAADLSHIPTNSKTIGSLPHPGAWPSRSNDGLAETLTGASLVVIPAGVPRKPGMTRDDLFNTNASIVKTLVEGCAEFCPEAVVAIISNPVNSTVPIAAEILKQKGVYDPKKLIGVTTLDVCRANTFVAHNQGLDPQNVNVKVIGGHAGITILPLFSQLEGMNLSDADIDALTVRTQFGGDEVVKAKAGAGSATLSMAYAGFICAENVLKGLNGEEVEMCAYVESNLTEASFFASPCRFGKNGVEEVLGFGELSAYEKSWFDKMIPDLKKQIQKGVDYANQ
uniref:Malate dehydrogenase n=1 Tax=Eucampia antarctica TaxID=49252 RepID=A0A7S2RGZ8_9STRA|mmetsp:Transcript_22069/g.21209  ORF Transcript_22069/g.21209 Transcript_22069/m.21209 type:complete len:344 (+) Transcript_22069:103-1134(+)|eukprot:CAMPEP_0197824478 /NCGR_PEP_ID=MMETSP1437-20131217/1703_1 /TAXON_ID=49252 ORGANISM="Eucampia antarctica, Strain CCMP1452" /NCGR_SAMPLE_ID=MMETSP1437 /ASSEMBLY_ACC=CAM_ASM_001096 /LENGTH=343 /DNA_ID=CAMNT_0043424109 /DNA_START=161 /DNA_END=1192 /DNA_ORIENTATION=-